jgi:hypothetical protein
VNQIDEASVDLAILNGIMMLQQGSERNALNSLE